MGTRNDFLGKLKQLFLFFIISFIFFFLFSPSYVSACDGCIDDDAKCFSYGIRRDGQFCSLSGSFVEQKAELRSCENNFECRSNLCVEDRCVNSNILRRIFHWVLNTFFRR